MSTLKDKGNDEFKKNNLQKAIQLYSQYVEQDNKDNQLAYTNIAMCYFKLRDWNKTIQACQNALLCNKQLPKPYYRLYLTYREIPNQEYQVFINAYLFLKYFTQSNTNAKAEAVSIMREFKNKFINKKIEKNNNINEDIFKDFEAMNIQNNSKIIQQPSSIFEWEDYLQSQHIQIKQKCQKIKQIAVNQHDLAVNLAYLLLNRCSKPQDKNLVKQKIIQLKKQQFYLKKQQQKIQAIEVQQESRINEQSQENLFQSQSQRVQVNNEQKQQKNHDQQQKLKSQESINIDSKKIIEENVQLDNNTLAQQSTVGEKSQYVSTVKQIENQIDLLLKKLNQNSRDIFNDVYQHVIQVLSSNRTVQTKKNYLLLFHKKCKQIQLKNSFSQKQQKIIYGLLVKNRIEDLYEIYAPKGK